MPHSATVLLPDFVVDLVRNKALLSISSGLHPSSSLCCIQRYLAPSFAAQTLAFQFKSVDSYC